MKKVNHIQELAQVSEQLKAQGMVAVKPMAYGNGKHSGVKTFSWNNYIHSMLISQSNTGALDSNGARQEISTVFGSSGGENKAIPQQEGTPGLGFMEWGQGNRLPNLVWMLTKMMPFTSAGWDFIKKILVGHGPVPKYHYTQYVGGNITEKYIPYESAGTLLRGQIADLKSRQQSQNAQASSLSNAQASQTNASASSTSPSQSVTGSNAQASSPSSDQSLDPQIAELQAALDEWTRTAPEVKKFCEDNDLMHTYLNLSGDMALMSQCFVELQLNQRQLNSDGVPTPTSQWTPKVIGIKPRSIFTTRLERMDENYRINYAYLSNQWLDSTQQPASLKPEDQKIAAIPYLASNSAVQDLQRKVREARQNRVSRKNRPTRFIMSPRDFGGPYYADSSWHSIFAGSIFEYAFTIVDDRLTRKRNSNIIGRVIYIHQDYLSALFRQQGNSDKKKSMAQIQSEVFDSINTWLANPDNAGQALISSVFTGPDGKEHKAWEIVEIETKAKDKSEAEKTELQEISSIIFFAMGLDGKIIGNTPGDATSSGGTDLRERFLVKQIQFAPLQQLMLRPLEVISSFNQWDEHLVWQIDREVLTTLDNSKTGVTKQE